MSKLEFDIKANWQELDRLNKELDRYVSILEKIDVAKNPEHAQELVRSITKTKTELDNMVTSTIKAGRELDEGFKKKIYDSAIVVNDLTEKIIAQRDVVRQNQIQVRGLTEEYRKMDKADPNRANLLKTLNATKASLNQEKIALSGLQSEQASARLSVKRLKDEYEAFREESSQTINVTNASSAAFTKMFAAIGGVAAVKMFASSIIDVRAQMEGLSKSYEVLLGSKQKADAMLSEIKEYAIISPLELSDLTSAAQTMMGFGVSVEEVLPLLKQLGDVSMGESGRFQSLSLAFSQVYSAGKLMGQDLNQMINAGFNPLKEMSKTTGKSIAELKKEMEGGAISAQMVADAFKTATAEGGQFYGMTEKAAEGISSYQSNFANAIKEVLNDIGEKNEDLIKSGYEGATVLVNNYDKIGKALLTLVAAVGTYKAALIVTNVIEGNIASKRLLITVIGNLRKAQMLLNATMMANPYALVLAGVVGLTTAMVAFSKSTSTAEKEQKKLNDRYEELNSLSEQRASKSKELLAIVQDETKVETDRVKAFMELQSIYPGLFGNMDIEKVKVLDLKEAYKQLNQEEGRRIGQEKQKELDSLYKQSKALVSDIETYKTIPGYKSEIRTKEAEEKLKEVNKQINKLEEEKKAYLEVKKQTDIKDVVKNKTYWEDQKKAAIKALEGISSEEKRLLDSGKKDGVSKSTLEKYVANKKIVAQANKELKLYDEKEATKVEDAAKQINEKVIASDLALNGERLNILEDGRQKRLAQNKQEHEEKKAAIEKEYRELKESYKKAGKSMPKSVSVSYDERIQNVDMSKSFNDNKINKEFNKDFIEHQKAVTQAFLTEEARRVSAIKDRYDKEREWAKLQLDGNNISKSEYDSFVSQSNNAEAYERLDGMLKKYQDYTAKKFQMEQNFNEELKTLNEARTAANSEEIDRSIAELNKQQKRALSNVDLESLKEEINWADVFGNIENVATDSLVRLRDQLAEFINSVGDSISPENLKEIMDALDKIDWSLAGRDSISSLKDAYEDYKSTTLEVIQAQERLNELQESGSASEKELKDATEKLTEAQNKRQKSLTSMTMAVNSIGDKGGELVKAGNDIVDMLTSLGVEVPESVKGILDGAGQIVDSLASLDLTKPFSVISATTGVLAGLAKTIGSLFGLGGADYSEYNKLKEKYEGLMDIWDELLTKKKNYISMSTADEVNRVEKETLELLGKQEEAIRKLAEARLKSGASAGSHSIQYRMWQGSYKFDGKNWKDVAGEISKEIGVEFDGMNDMLNMTGEQLLWIKENYSGLWMTMDADFRGYLEQLIEYGDEAKDIVEQVKESLTQVSFDTVKGDFLNTLMDMDSSAEDFADNMTKYMQKAILNTMLSQTYEKQLKQWYDNFADANRQDGISKEEYDKLQEEWKNLVADAVKDRDELKDLLGWESDTVKQQASNGGFSTMSQETGNELNGRFTALQMAGEEIKAQNQQQTSFLQYISKAFDSALAYVADSRDVLSESRTILMNSFMELQDINNNTANMSKKLDVVVQRLDKIQQNTSKL